MRRSRLAVFAAIAVAIGVGSAHADGVTLHPGDIVVAVPTSFGPQGCCISNIVHVDAETHAQTVVTSGGLLVAP